MSEIENGRLHLHGTGHWKCNHLTTVGFKGLNKFCIQFADAVGWDDEKDIRPAKVPLCHFSEVPGLMRPNG